MLLSSRELTQVSVFEAFELHEFQRRWLALFAAVAERDAGRMADLAGAMLAEQKQLGRDAREYLVVAGMTGHIAAARQPEAKKLWTEQVSELRNPNAPLLRLLRCHAERATAQPDAACAAAFAAYAD